jgi:YD repeat-containing protein
MKHTSSLIHRYTLNASNTTESLYTYDPSFNRISKTIDGFDGLQFTRHTEYDLFNNLVKHTKNQTKDRVTTRGETDLKQYNADNQLISVTTPENMTTQYVNDKAGRRIKTIQPDGEEIHFEYNALGQIVKNSWMLALIALKSQNPTMLTIISSHYPITTIRSSTTAIYRMVCFIRLLTLTEIH